MSLLLRTASLALPFALLAACSAGGGGRPDGGGGGTMDGSMVTPDGGTMSMFDTGPRIPDSGFDPFDPDSSCGAAAIPTERVPGSLLIVFDRSGSMRDAPSGDVSGSNPSKWDRARTAMDNVLSGVSDDLSAGLLLFSSDGDCGVSSTPNVPIAPLSTSRSMISSALGGSSPGGNTPAFAALLAGYDYLDTLDTPGQRGIVLVSDGGESCDLADSDAVFARVQMEHDVNNRLTFAVGLNYADNNLSTIAYNGGTPRNTTCRPECTSVLCTTAAECPSGTSCYSVIAGFPGFCTCNTNADCVSPQTCMPGFSLPPPLPSIPAQCGGDADCCHYNAAASDFQAQFEAAVADIAARLLDSCVFDLPRGTDPSMFDPSLVNVGVTFDGETRTVLIRSSDGGVDSWNYTTPENQSIIIQGPICDRLLEGGSASVEIVLGCPTILI